MSDTTGSAEPQQLDLKRAADCVNACSGIANPEVVIPALIKAATTMRDRLEQAINRGCCMKYADAVNGDAGAAVGDYAIIRAATDGLGKTT